MSWLFYFLYDETCLLKTANFVAEERAGEETERGELDRRTELKVL